MSNYQAKTHPNSLGNAPGSFPILMRMPDLRSGNKACEAVAIEAAFAAECEPTTAQSQAEAAVTVVAPATVPTKTVIASEPDSSAKEKKIAPPVESPTPAAQRRQRALERQRRLETETTPRSWWTSHAPVLAGGFLVALVITVVMARNNREQPTPAEQARMEPPTPELEIEIGGPSLEATSPGTPLAAPPELIGGIQTSPVEATPSKASSKLPALLSAAPKVPELEPQATTVATETTLPPLPEERVAAKAPVTEPLAPPTSSRTSEFPSGNDGYPNIEAGSLNAPAAPSSSGSEPTYPSTSTPNSWR